MADLSSTTALLSLFADPTRVRLMAVLWDEEHSVAELTRILEVSQSRVSTHLGRLREAGVLHDRRVGASTFYRAHPDRMPAPARRTWELLVDQLDDTVLGSDKQRSENIVRARSEGAWPDAIAGRMEHHYSPGRTWEALTRGVLGLLRLGDVLDVGSGDGVMARLLAGRARSITCVDRSERVIEAAKERLRHLANVRLLVGDMHALPLPDASFDEVLLFNVLTYAHDPPAALAEAFRVLRPKGTLAVVTLDAHNHPEISSTYQHVNTGFSPEALTRLLEGAGFDLDSCEVSSRERRKPYFQVVSAFARRRATEAAARAS